MLSSLVILCNRNIEKKNQKKNLNKYKTRKILWAMVAVHVNILFQYKLYKVQ